MRQIPIKRRNGSIRAHALVDDGDYEVVGRFRWTTTGGYVTRTDRSGVQQRTVLLHRQIMGLVAGDKREVDHINGNPLDCRRENLRVVTHAQNAQNRTRVHGRSRFRGVAWNPARRAWAVRVGRDYKRYFGGYFEDEEEAGAAAAALRAELLTHAAECA